MTLLTQFSIDRPLYTWLIMLACILGGVIGVNTIGQLEDPPYPVKQAYIFTSYPGASAEEVEQEVTEVVESSLQELPYVRFITSKSVAGLSEVMIELHQSVSKADTPQIWDEMRRRVAEAGSRLPVGTSEPHVEDDFADVYGIMYAVTTPPGYTPDEISDVARTIETRLKLVPHVAKVRTDGVPQEAIFIEIDKPRMRRLGLPLEALLQGIGAENQIHPAGFMEIGERRLRIAPPMAFDSVEAVAQMRIGRPGSVEIVPLSDFATVTRGEVEQPPLIIRHQGQRAFTVGVSVVETENVVEVGREVDARMNQLKALLPIGVEVVPIYRQHAVVAKSVDEFMVNLIASVFTVIATLCLFMGWRAGAVVGAVLLLTVLGTLGIMAYGNIALQRISLGALMIAMGMLVDNAIVVAEGMITDVQRGKSSRDAAIRAVERTRFPLLGATVIGIAAFAPIGLSSDSTGQFLGSLFQVVGISLLLSWFLAITVAPMLGAYFLRVSTVPVSEQELYASGGYRFYQKLLGTSLRHRWWVTLLMVVITLVSLWGFGFVKQGFFPSNSTPLFYVDMFLPQGTDIKTTESEVEHIEDLIREEAGVSAITSFVGVVPRVLS
ncbi:MAG: efflux RND transporter permease subunit [Porticoccaceae bacterium]